MAQLPIAAVPRCDDTTWPSGRDSFSHRGPQNLLEPAAAFELAHAHTCEACSGPKEYDLEQREEPEESWCNAVGQFCGQQQHLVNRGMLVKAAKQFRLSR